MVRAPPKRCRRESLRIVLIRAISLQPLVRLMPVSKTVVVQWAAHGFSVFLTRLMKSIGLILGMKGEKTNTSSLKSTPSSFPLRSL